MKRLLVATAATTLLVLSSTGAAHAAKPAKKYSNCAALNHAYPHGVGKKGAHDHVSSGTPVTSFTRSSKLYAANSGSDRDHDGIACEKK